MLSLIVHRFLLAGLHLKTIMSCMNAKTRKCAASKLPEGLNAAYEEEMGRLKRKGNESYEVAKRALSWIHFAKRPLRMVELQEAIAIDPIEDIENGNEDCHDLDRDAFTDSHEIVDCCGSLILWDISTDIVAVSHYTVAEFFKFNAYGNIEPELYVARACLTYLCFDVFSRNYNDLLEEKYRTAQYIGQFWGNHVLGSKDEKSLQDLVLSVLWSARRRFFLASLDVSK
jgi:hypothetical protein